MVKEREGGQRGKQGGMGGGGLELGGIRRAYLSEGLIAKSSHFQVFYNLSNRSINLLNEDNLDGKEE